MARWVRLLLVAILGLATALQPRQVSAAQFFGILDLAYVGNREVDITFGSFWSSYTGPLTPPQPPPGDCTPVAQLYRGGQLLSTMSGLDQQRAFLDTGLQKGGSYTYEVRVLCGSTLWDTRSASVTAGQVRGTIREGTTKTWSGDTWELHNQVTVAEGARLVIAPGTTVAGASRARSRARTRGS